MPNAHQSSPAELIERREAQTCAGCAWLGRGLVKGAWQDVCRNTRAPFRSRESHQRCDHYEERS